MSVDGRGMRGWQGRAGGGRVRGGDGRWIGRGAGDGGRKPHPPFHDLPWHLRLERCRQGLGLPCPIRIIGFPVKEGLIGLPVLVHRPLHCRWGLIQQPFQRTLHGPRVPPQGAPRRLRVHAHDLHQPRHALGVLGRYRPMLRGRQGRQGQGRGVDDRCAPIAEACECINHRPPGGAEAGNDRSFVQCGKDAL